MHGLWLCSAVLCSTALYCALLCCAVLPLLLRSILMISFIPLPFSFAIMDSLSLSFVAFVPRVCWCSQGWRRLVETAEEENLEAVTRAAITARARARATTATAMRTAGFQNSRIPAQTAEAPSGSQQLVISPKHSSRVLPTSLRKNKCANTVRCGNTPSANAVLATLSTITFGQTAVLVLVVVDAC